jgi:small subunit ribosomal protein S17
MAFKKRRIDIGLDAKKPKGSCGSSKCPWHGLLKVRGRVFEGKVVSDRAPSTVTVQWDFSSFVPKYERFARKRTKMHAHNPECIDAKMGDVVKIAECRPLSKSKSFVVIEKLEEMVKK